MNRRDSLPAVRQTSLFRPEALQRHIDPVLGSVLVAAPAAFSVTATAIGLAAAALIAIIGFGSYAQRETVDGYIAVTDGDIRVFPQAAGEVANLRVREGSYVAAGDALFSLLTSRNDAMSAEANNEIQVGIIAEQQALQDQARDQERYFAAELERLQRSSQHTEARILLLLRQRKLAERKLDLVHRDVRRLNQIHDQGYLAERDQDSLAIVAVDSELAVESISLRLSELQADLQDTNSRMAQIEFLRGARLAEIDGDSGQVSQRLAAIRAGLVQVVSSPVGGRVSALHVIEGQSVRSDTLALSVLPDDSDYHAELLVPGRNMGLLDEGQPVDLRFDAYPFEKFGVYAATIEQIARSPLLPGDARFPIAVAEPVYRVKARLDRQSIDVEGVPRPLTPGLTFKADVLHSERTLLEWMLAPMIGAARRL
jgi:membrane fusion protein